MSIKIMEYWTDDPPVELSDSNYCKITTKNGNESAWYYRDLTRGKRKGWKECYTIVLGTDEFGMEIWRWRKRVCKPSDFYFSPRFPVRPTREMKLALTGRNKRVREKNMKIVNEDQGYFYDTSYRHWRKNVGESNV
jgi:hypothetical protein